MTLFPVGLQPSIQLVLDDPEVAFFEWEANLPVVSRRVAGNPVETAGAVADASRTNTGHQLLFGNDRQLKPAEFGRCRRWL